jgi:hypothetical protein
MKRAFLIIGLAIALFGVAAIAMSIYPHHKAYADCRGSGC